MLKLTDDQPATIPRAATPIDRGPFLDVIAARLRGIAVLGDGNVARIARDTQRESLRVPPPEVRTLPGKYGRG
jgi:hypothetical protein